MKPRRTMDLVVAEIYPRAHMIKKERNMPKYASELIFCLDEYFPARKTFWILFDTANGDKLTKRYCWWFDTRKQAREHKARQKKMLYGAPLIGPFKFYLK